MSRSVDLFLSPDMPLDELAELVATRSGLDVRPAGDDECFELVDGELMACLHPNHIAGDEELPLGRYPYALSMQTTATGHLGTSLEVGLLRRVAACFERGVLLVLDLQYRDQPPPSSPRGPGGT